MHLFKSHSPGSSQSMMNISEQFVDFVWVIYQRPFFVLFIHIMYVHKYSVFKYYILQYITYIYIYPRWLGMLTDKADKEKWLPLLHLSLKHKKKKAKTHHLIQHTIQKECAKTHQANQAPQASKATRIKCKCKEFKKTQRQHKTIGSTISFSHFLVSLVHYGVTWHKMTTFSS